MIDNPIIKSLCERRSVKSYKPEQIADEQLDTILEAATYAPTGRNAMSPVMVVVQDAELLAKIEKLNAVAIGDPGSHPFYGAPTVVVVFGNPEYSHWMEDASLVAGNLLNAAHAVGVGGCWIHRARPVFETPEGKAMMRAWGVPENFIGVANCILGYQDAPAKPRVARKEGYVIKAR
ncbi:MAG: nitroreductase family protein [Bacteroidales bacterium]|nr:nitroreductase family protein [Bacteroidales bacterium]